MSHFLARLTTWPELDYVYLLKEHRWGQRSICFYDPDHHVIEVGEAIATVVQRFLAQGMTVEETAKRMDVPEDYVRVCSLP